ncbi:MAG TPA: outer membrane lipoprotein carrier protein LolA [Opitutaceae bacterium]|jgi:hypothetical protein|nr:outer membrane lipoprotein carrier protein LolA [Opitutaceae bacterium]
MKRALTVFLLLALVPCVRAAGPGEPLTPESAAGEWKPLLTALATKGSIRASFTERRYFPFRHDPTILTGTLRVSPERGLSLQYMNPEPSVLIADATGIMLRDASGHDSAMPADSHQAGAISSLLPIMRFDLAALFPKFNILAQRTGPDWRFQFTSKDAQAAPALGVITVVGTDENVRHLEFKRSEHQRIEIEVEDTQAGVSFSPSEVRQYFR